MLIQSNLCLRECCNWILIFLKRNRTAHFNSSRTSYSLWLWQSCRMENLLLLCLTGTPWFFFSLFLHQVLCYRVVTFLIFGFFMVSSLSVGGSFILPCSIAASFLEIFEYNFGWILLQETQSKPKLTRKANQKILRFKPQGSDSFKAQKQHGKLQPRTLKFSIIPNYWKEGFRANGSTWKNRNGPITAS